MIAWKEAGAVLMLAAVVWPGTVWARTSSGGGCGEGVGGLLDDIPGSVECPGGYWSDPRVGSRSTASWAASASEGALHAQAVVNIDTTSIGSSVPLALGVVVSAYASFGDTVTIDAPGLAGQTGRMTFLMDVDGNMGLQKFGANSAARADWQLTVSHSSQGRLLGSAGASGGVTHFYDWAPTGVPSVHATYQFELPVVFGQPMDLIASLNVYASASAWRAGSPGTPEYYLPTTSAADANFGHTITWGGITGIRLTSGSTVTDWSITSTSGVDYKEPVPEPEGWVMLFAGVAGLLWVPRHGRKAEKHHRTQAYARNAPGPAHSSS